MYPWHNRLPKRTRKVLFRELLAGFGRLANLLSNGFPLIILVLLDGVEKVLFLKNILLVTSVQKMV